MSDVKPQALEREKDLGEVDHEGIDVVVNQEPKESEDDARRSEGQDGHPR